MGTWRAAETDEPLETYSLIMTEPNELMPTILDASDFGKWLSHDTKPAELAALLKPYPAELMAAHKVSTFVNSPRNDDERCAAPAG